MMPSMPSGSIIERVAIWAAAALAFLITVAPTTLDLPKMALLGLLLVLTLGWLARHPSALRDSRPLVLGILAAAALGTAYAVYGYLAKAPGALPSARVYVIWLLVYGLLILAVRSVRMVRALLLAVVAGIAVSGVLGVAYILTGAGLLPDAVLSLPFFPKASFMQLPGQSVPAASFLFLASYLFGVPLCLALLLTPRSARQGWLPGWLLWTATGLSLGVTLLSGRRAILLAIFGAAVAWLLMTWLTSGRPFGALTWRRVVGVVAGVALSLVVTVGGYIATRPLQYAGSHLTVAERDYLVKRNTGGGGGDDSGVGQVITDFSKGFDTAGNEDAQARAKQAGVLLDRFKERPIFGWGLGANTPGYERSSTQSWAYELTYVVWLMSFGAVGTAAYALLLLAVFVGGIVVGRRRPLYRPYLIAAATGLTGFLIGNATNPYLAKFDGLFSLFLTLAVLNAARVGREGEQVVDQDATVGGVRAR